MPQFEQISVFSSLIFWSFVSFLLLFFVLKRYAFPPILDALEERRKKIQSDLGDAEKLKTEAQKMKEELERELDAAHDKANTIVQMANSEAKKMQDRALEETQNKIRQMQSQAERDIEASRNKLMSEIRNYTATLTVASAERFLRKTLDPEAKKKLAEESIQEVIREMGRTMKN